MAEQYSFAARALEKSWPLPNSNISVRHVLRYFLLRGMIHVGCNDWTMAVRCFWTCLSIPSEIVSLLAVSAWKKLLLVQCLQMEEDDYRPVAEPKNIFSASPMAMSTTSSSSSSTSTSTSSLGGGPMAVPKALPTCMSRFLSMASNKTTQKNQPEEVMVQEDFGEPSSIHQQQQQQQQPSEGQQQQQQPAHPGQQTPYVAMGVKVYMDLVHAFVSGDRAKFQNLKQQHGNLLQADGNMGLVHQCETAMFDRQVYQLSRMYSVIPLADLAAKVNVDSPEQMKHILQQLSMKSTTRKTKYSKWPTLEMDDDGLVAFNFESTTTHSEELRGLEEPSEEQELEDKIQELIHLTNQLQRLDVSIATSPMYHALSRRSNADSKPVPRGVDDL